MIFPLQHDDGFGADSSRSLSELVEVTDQGERRSIRRSELYPCNPDDQLGVADNCALLHLHEPGRSVSHSALF
jgi:hypothetical protein